MSVNRSPRRRRQRSVRLTVAVAVLTVGTGLVVGALVLKSPGLLQLSLVVVLVMGWAVLRIMWSEILAARFEHAAERTRTARAATNRALDRAAQNAVFVATMNKRLAASRQTVQELATAAAAAQHKAARLELLLSAEQRRADEAAGRIAELERDIEALVTETELHRTGLSDLMSFEERVKQASTSEAEDRRLA